MIKEERLAQIKELGDSLSYVDSFEKLGDLLIVKIGKIFGARKVSLMLLDKENKELFVHAASDMKEEFKKVKVEYGQMFAGWVAKEGQPLLVKNVDTEFPNFSKAKLGRYKSKSFLIAPIKSLAKTLGVINITEREDAEIFDEDDLETIALINPLVMLQMEKLQLLQQIEGLSNMDSLTGLFNHRYFQERLSEEVERAQRYRRPFSFVLINIDNFQDYNETYGYAMGDRVLTQMATILRENLRKVDIIARYSGEEFSIILPDTNRKQALMVTEKIRDKVASAVFVERRTSSLAMARLTVSIGLSEYDVRNNKEEFIDHVADALSEAKQKGKNRVVVYK